MLCVNKLCYILIISITPMFIFNFLIFIHFTSQIILKPSLAQKLKLQFKFNTIKRQINPAFWTQMGHKRWRKDGKTFIRCHAIALKFWDEFNANFILLYFSTFSSIKICHLCLKDMEKNSKAVPLMLLLTYLL